MLPPNIRVDRNCQPTWVTQNAIPEEQELILLGGGIRCPPPTDTGLKEILFNIQQQDPRLQGSAPGFRQGQDRDKTGMRWGAGWSWCE